MSFFQSKQNVVLMICCFQIHVNIKTNTSSMYVLFCDRSKEACVKNSCFFMFYMCLPFHRATKHVISVYMIQLVLYEKSFKSKTLFTLNYEVKKASKSID